VRSLALACLLIAVATSAARAEFVMCIGGQGAAPAAGSTVPPHAHLAFYSDRTLRLPTKVTATIDGATVKVKNAITKPFAATPFQILSIEIDSARTGTLVVTYENHAPLTYQVKAGAMPKDISGVIGRYQGPQSNGRGEEFDGLAIRLPAGTPAVIGHIRWRHAGDAWSELDVAAYTADNETRPMLRVGQFACDSSVPLVDLARGFDIEATVMLADGSTRPVTGLAPHMTLPEPLPPQPRPKNAR
jgi:hypothetical protein